MYKIYIVEDDKGIADGITSCLANWGMEGRTVSDFMNVMEEVKEYEPHLIILYLFHYIHEIGHGPSFHAPVSKT